MFAKLNHVAIVSENFPKAAQFYQAVFGMKTSPDARPGTAVTVGDGYVGLNINPRYAGRPAHLDHFGIEVEDAELAFDRIDQKYPRMKRVKRPGNRPFAGITTHDMDGNVFDISQRNMENRRDMYVENAGVGDCFISHVAMKTMNPDDVAEMYQEVFELQPRNKQPGDPNHYLTDGHVTLVIMPWDITDYSKSSIIPAGMEHIGFTVTDYAAFKERSDKLFAANPLMAPLPIGGGPEGQARLDKIRSGCALYQHHLTDCDGILLSVAEK